MLFTLARQDPVFKPIIKALENNSYAIKHTYWGRPGAYIPQSDQSAPAKFRFSYRHGFSIVSHTFLHELVHFKQDIENKLPAPHITETVQDYITQTLSCEAQAQAQALAASWRLKQAGHPQAWNGALLSFDWRTLAKSYETSMISECTEKEAIQTCIKNWYETPQRKYYERQAEKIFKSHNLK